MADNQVRIIGGKWRSRKLKVLDLPGLRPTPDRVRETLFNWLAPHISGANCLDLFAGTGALGFEALSRGARFVEMVDADIAIVKLLNEELQRFDAKAHARITFAKLPEALPHFDVPFDIVFIDPPYHSNLWQISSQQLEEKKYLAPSAYIYIEANNVITDNDLPESWRIIKRKKAGQVFYHLVLRELRTQD